MSDERASEYSNSKITVVWKPDLCVHAGECVRGSVDVFKPDKKPWVQIDASSSKAIMETIDKCPSGALSYRVENEVEATIEDSTTFRIKASKNGPFLISGDLEIEDASGNVKVCDGKTTALCRCGASRTKPFCDGSHTNVKFFG